MPLPPAATKGVTEWLTRGNYSPEFHPPPPAATKGVTEGYNCGTKDRAMMNSSQGSELL